MAQNDIADRHLAHLFIHIGKLLREKLSGALSERGLHFGQARILEALLRNGKLNQGKIGRELQIKPATVTNQVKRMEVSGLITRRKDSKDDRFMIVSLTPKGREAAKFILSEMNKGEVAICSAITKKQVEMMRKPLEEIRDKLGGIGPSI